MISGTFLDLEMTDSMHRKRRTRAHVIAAQSANYVERFIIDEGHTCQRTESDYGYDLVMYTFDREGYVEPGVVYLQLKAAEELSETDQEFPYNLDIRDYNLWQSEPMPVILVLFDASKRRGYWLHVQQYFNQDERRRPKKGAKWVRVRVPNRQRLGRRAIAAMRAAKQYVLNVVGR